MTLELMALTVGVFIGGLIVYLLHPLVKVGINMLARRFGISRPVFTILAALVMSGAFASATFAQTPVPINIPVNTIFTETNNWIATFAPIAAIGIGITLALAVLGYLGKMIASAFRN